MSSRFHGITRAAAIAAMLALQRAAFAQSDDADAEMRIQQLENQLRQLTGQNEELQYRNRQLEERLRALQGGAQAAARPPADVSPISPRARPRHPQRNRATASRNRYQPQAIAAGGYDAAADRRAGADRAGARRHRRRRRAGRRGDAFDPSQNPNAPGAPQALGGGQLPIPAEAAVGAPGGRGAGEPLDLANTGGRAIRAGALPPPPCSRRERRARPPCRRRRRRRTSSISASATCSARIMRWPKRPCATSRRNIPATPWSADSQYWLGESFFQRQLYRDAAETFLARDHQIRQIGQGAGRPAAARPVAGGAEGEGSRLRGARRGDAEISARLRRRQSRPSTASRSG